MGKKGGGEVPWVEYYISMHVGYCHGPVDAVREVIVREKSAWSGSLSSSGMVRIDQDELFGGKHKEGGVRGDVHMMLGSEEQMAPRALGVRMEYEPHEMPGFRGVASIFFCGDDDDEGLYVGANMPSVPPIWARFIRTPKGLDVGPIMNVDFDRVDANPAAIIYECLINKSWGMGGSTAQIDAASFSQAAETLAQENFGLSMIWTKQSSVESFISEILDHIQAVFYFNPRTGKATLKLLRDDYDPNNLRALTPSNCKLSTFRRAMWGETINEINITWTNPENEEEETITYQDLSNIAMQGQVVSETRNYYGIRSPTLASEIGARDIVSAAMPLASAKVRANRQFWDILPGEVVELDFPLKGIHRIPMRVMNVDYGEYDNSEIEIELLEDIFGMPHAEYIDPPTTEWVPPVETPLDENIHHPVYWVAVPYAFVSEVDFGEYPETMVAGLMVEDRDKIPDLMGYRLNGQSALPNGTSTWTSHGNKTLTPAAMLDGQLDAAAISEIVWPSDADEVPEIGDVLMFGEIVPHPSGASGFEWEDPETGEWELLDFEMFKERREELCLVDAKVGEDGDGNPIFRIWRGILDTTPKTWGSGKAIYLLSRGLNVIDPVPQPAYSDINYRVQLRTQTGLQSIENGENFVTRHPPRPHLPLRPANCKVDGVSFGEDKTQLTNYGPRKATIDLSWARRNRLMEDRIFRRWDDVDVSPEIDQTTVIFAIGSRGNRQVIQGLTGTSHSIDVWLTGQDEKWTFRFFSMRDGLLSLQGHELEINLYPKGFGSDYGYYFGGWPDEPSFGDRGPVRVRIDDGAFKNLED